MRIHQFVHTLNYGDAISGEALAISRLLRKGGHESLIYSVNTHEKLEGQSRDYRSFREDLSLEKEEKTAVILHYSIASPLNQLLLEEPGIVRGLIYHNLTPVKWFAAYNHRVAEDLRKGVKELPKLLDKVDFVWADSEYNRKELRTFGCERAQVLPLLFDEEKWSVSANPGICNVLKGHGGKNLLHVGRLAPNKCIEDIIKAFYFYHHKIEKNSRLWLIGSDIDTEIYSFELRSMVSELRLKEAVSFVGSVSNGELRAFYENADLYLCMSEHEGFCLPLLEAMQFQVPVIAFDSAAVSETLGNGGMMLAQKDPSRLAELIDLVIVDPEIRQKLISEGKERVRAFSESQFANALEEKLLLPLLKAGGGR